VADVTTIAVAWMLALGMSVAVYKKVHITIDFVKNKFPHKAKKVLETILTLLMIAFLIILIFAGWKTTVMKMRIHFVVLYIPTAYAFMALPVFAFFSTIFMTYRLKDILLSKEE
jgi:TRAP-type C4-dicarboxylate transport system permease small subunit